MLIRFKAVHNCSAKYTEQGFYKQAIWAWTKYIKHNRGDYAAHRDRILVYEAYIDQQAGSGSIARLVRMAVQAVKSMLSSFPGDAFAASKMPMVLYKAGRADQCAFQNCSETRAAQPVL